MERVIRMESSYEHAPFLCFGEKFRGKNGTIEGSQFWDFDTRNGTRA